MAWKSGLIKTLFVAGLSVMGWCLQTQIASNTSHEKRLTVLEQTKADKEVVNELRVQIVRQTTILENQSRLMEQQHELLREVVASH